MGLTERIETLKEFWEREIAESAKTAMECLECGHKFSKRITGGTFEVRCPKCGGYDTDIDYGVSSKNLKTLKKGTKIQLIKKDGG